MREHTLQVRIRRAASEVACRFGRFGCGVAAAYHEQTRISAIMMSADRHLAQASTPPDTYGEFLLRTSGPLRYEPTARARFSGQPVH